MNILLSVCFSSAADIKGIGSAFHSFTYIFLVKSAGKKKSVKITRAGVYIKPMLVQVAHAAVKCTSQPYYKVKYESIARRRGKKRAIIAIARMILTAIYHMFCTGEVFNPTDLRQIDMPKELKKKNVANAIRLLKQQGVLPENFTEASYA